MEAAFKRNEIVLGGCCIFGDERDKAFECQACGGRFGAMDWERVRALGAGVAAEWDQVREKVELAMCEVMLNDDWRHAPALTLALKSCLELHAPPAVKARSVRLVQLLDTPLGDLTDVQRGDVSNELMDLLVFVCRQGAVAERESKIGTR